jgi:hypothetical protein
MKKGCTKNTVYTWPDYSHFHIRLAGYRVWIGRYVAGFCIHKMGISGKIPQPPELQYFFTMYRYILTKFLIIRMNNLSETKCSFPLLKCRHQLFTGTRTQCCGAGAARSRIFGRSRSRNAMQLRLRRLRHWYYTWLGIEKWHKILQFITHSVHILCNTNRTESYEQNSFNMCINLSSF